MTGRAANAPDRDDDHVDWESRPRAGWDEFCAARERLSAHLDRHKTLYRLEHAPEVGVIEDRLALPQRHERRFTPEGGGHPDRPD